MIMLGRLLRTVGATAMLVAGAAATANAEEVVRIGGGLAMLNLPAGKPTAGLVLLPGGDGHIGIDESGGIRRQVNWIVRTRASYRGARMASLLLDAGVGVGQAMDVMRRRTGRVVLVAMSRGSLKVPGALAQRPSGVVFASSMLSAVRGSLGSPSALPPTLIVHHRRDECRVTHADDVAPFQQWAGGKVRVRWIDGGAEPRGRRCGPRHYHGFVGREGAVVAAIVAFARTLR